MKNIIVLLAIVLISACKSDQKSVQAPPPKVTTVAVTSERVELKKDFVAQIFGKLDIPIRARVEGFLEGIHFEEGGRVRKGQLLYTIDSQPFDAAVSAAQSELAEAQVSLVKAENDLERVEPLAEMNAVSGRDLDAAVAERGAAEAMVEASRARLRAEEINRSYTKILSPINGLIGKTNAKVGEFVGRNPNPVILNTVSLIDSIRVEFFITEKDYLALVREVQKSKNQMAKNSRVSSESEPSPFSLSLILADGSIFPHNGKVDFINREVDQTTGSILIQATFPNPEQLIRPGQFGRVRATVQNMEGGLVIPQRCVTEFQGIHNVMLLSDSNKVVQKQIQIGSIYKDYFLVLDGLKEGDVIVFEGLQKISDGTVVTPELIQFESNYKAD